MRRLVLVSILGAAIASGQVAPSWKDLKFPPLKQVTIPQPATFTLPNGMKLYLLEDHELPLVSGFALVRTGNLFDPPDKRGLSEIMAMVMRTGGTKTKTGDQLDVELEDVAASVESNMGESSATASFSCLKDNTDQVLGIFKNVLTSPEFRQEKIDLAKSQMRSAIARRNDDAATVAAREFASIIYGRDTPYGWNIEYADVDRIQRPDLVNFYQRYYFPANIMLAVYGDFSTAGMHAKLERLFADWNVKQPPVPPFPPVRNTPEPGVYLAEKTDVTQTFFEVGHLGGLLKDKDYPALQVAADILGSGFTSRLVNRVRTELGYAYSINASWDANYSKLGLFDISGSTKSKTTEETLAVIREEVEKMRTAEVTEQELQTAKDRVLNSFVFNFDRPSKTLNRLMLYEYFGYPKDFIFQYQKAVAAVTRADVLRVAKEHWRSENLTMVAVGNSKEFGKPLSALGTVHMIDLTIPQPKQETAKADTASLARGKALLERAQQAMGGAEKLAAIRDSTQIAQMQISAGPAMIIKQNNQYLAPGHLRQDQELPFGKITVYSDGQTGWMVTPQGLQPMTPAVVQQVKGELFHLIYRLVLSDRDPNRQVNDLGKGVLEITDKGGLSAKLEIDEQTGLPAKESYLSPGLGGAPSAVEEIFSDWRETGGVKLPFKITINQGGRKFAEVTVQEYKLNTGIQPEEISKKP